MSASHMRENSQFAIRHSPFATHHSPFVIRQDISSMWAMDKRNMSCTDTPIEVG